MHPAPRPPRSDQWTSPLGKHRGQPFGLCDRTLTKNVVLHGLCMKSGTPAVRYSIQDDVQPPQASVKGFGVSGPPNIVKRRRCTLTRKAQNDSRHTHLSPASGSFASSEDLTETAARLCWGTAFPVSGPLIFPFVVNSWLYAIYTSGN